MVCNGDSGENPQATLIEGDDEAARDGFDRVETIGEERSSVDPGGYRVTTVRQNMGRTLWWLATEVMVKILCNSTCHSKLPELDSSTLP
jgi:hypothetical protein